MCGHFLKRGVLVAAFAACTAAPAHANETLTLAWQGGSREQLMREHVIPMFEAKHPVKISYVAMVSTKLLARLRAQKSNQDIDVALMDDGPLYQAGAEGVCSSSTPKYSSDLYSVANMDSANAVGVGVVATGIEYNTKTFESRGWAAPTSWKDLEDPKFKGQLGLLSISNTFGLHTLMMMSAANGGSAPGYDAGFKALSERVTPNVQAFVESSGTLSAAFQSGEIAIGVNSNGRTQALAATGFPVAFVYPKEGAVATVVGACVVEKPKPSKYAVEFVKFLLAPEIQALMAEKEGLSPVNKATQLSAKTKEMIPAGETAMAALVVPNWVELNKERNNLARRWAREVERKR